MTVPDSPKNTGRPGSGGTSINPSRGMVGVTSFYFLSFSTLFVHFASCLSLLCTLCDVWCLSRYPIIIRATKRCLLLAFLNHVACRNCLYSLSAEIVIYGWNPEHVVFRMAVNDVDNGHSSQSTFLTYVIFFYIFI